MFPPHLYEFFAEFPLLPNRRAANPEEWSDYMKEAASAHGQNATADRQEKLIGALEPLVEYAVHYRNLVLALSLGVQLVELHRGLR